MIRLDSGLGTKQFKMMRLYFMTNITQVKLAGFSNTFPSPLCTILREYQPNNPILDQNCHFSDLINGHPFAELYIFMGDTFNPNHSPTPGDIYQCAIIFES